LYVFVFIFASSRRCRKDKWWQLRRDGAYNCPSAHFLYLRYSGNRTISGIDL